MKMTAALVACVGLLILAWPVEAPLAQDAGSGSITGSVTADNGEVRALRVKARHDRNRITYTVFTVDGRYQIFTLPPGTYSVSVLEHEFESPVETVEVRVGQTSSVNLVLTARVRESDVELVEFDTLYPPSPMRDILMKTCFPCHGATGPSGGTVNFHERKLNEAGWRRAVSRMFEPAGLVPNEGAGPPMVTSAMVSPEQKEGIIQYLVENFGPTSTARTLKMDTLEREEDALANAIYIEYELPEVDRPAFSVGPPPRRGVHSVYPSDATPGVIWGSDIGSGAIVRLDTRNLDYADRFTEYQISTADNVNVVPHGIIEERGLVYWVERFGDHLGELNPATGQTQRYRLQQGGQAHTIRADSRGMLWYSYFSAASRIGRFDTRTKDIEEYEPADGWNGYGLTTDAQDRVWAVAISTGAQDTPAVHMYNQETLSWKAFTTSSPTRRPTVDSRGKVWVSHFFGNAISMIDPTTGEVTEYELPLRHGNPYEVWADHEDNLWIGTSSYGSLVKFDQGTREFTYFPLPGLDGHTPKVEVGRDNTIWFAVNYNQPIVVLKEHGNVPSD